MICLMTILHHPISLGFSFPVKENNHLHTQEEDDMTEKRNRGDASICECMEQVQLRTCQEVSDKRPQNGNGNQRDEKLEIQKRICCAEQVMNFKISIALTIHREDRKYGTEEKSQKSKNGRTG